MKTIRYIGCACFAAFILCHCTYVEPDDDTRSSTTITTEAVPGASVTTEETTTIHR